jgi:hypothetical protein
MDERLLFQNPFLSNAVNEASIWTRGGDEFPDVAAIHGTEFSALLRDVEVVRKDSSHTTQVRFVVGAGGSGKSHLFSRLRRRLAREALFAFASNPPTRASGIWHWILDKVVFGMRRPWLVDAEERRYSQLEAVLYPLLRKDPALSLDEIHAAWSGYSPQVQEQYLSRLHAELVPQGFDPQSLRVLMKALQPETRDLAYRWLGGSSNLLTEELAALGQAEPIDERSAQELLARFGRLCALAGKPIVLVLDQLDLMTQPAQIDEFQALLFELINNSQSWYVVISLVRDNYDIWNVRLTQALRSRLVHANGSLPLIELNALPRRDEMEALLRCRLAVSGLARLRAELNISDALYPLTPADIDELCGRGPAYPRELITRASARYIKRVQPQQHEPQSEEPLVDRMVAAFQEAREQIDHEVLRVDGDVLADRLAELVEVVAAADGRVVRCAAGPFESDGAYKGTDTVLDFGDRQIRLVAHHVHQGPQFPRFLERVKNLPAGSLLVRDAAVPVSGRVSVERLEAFKRDKRFVHLPRPQIADLYALGEVLAEMREGNFAALATTPPPTHENIRGALGTLSCLQQNDLTRAVWDALVAAPPPREVSVPPPAPQSPPPDALVLVDAISRIMRSTRWLVLERLRRKLETAQIVVSLDELKGALSVQPLTSSIACFPPDLHAASDIHILIWTAEEPGA